MEVWYDILMRELFEGTQSSGLVEEEATLDMGALACAAAETEATDQYVPRS